MRGSAPAARSRPTPTSSPTASRPRWTARWPIRGRRETEVRPGPAVFVACAAQFLIGADGLAVAIALPSLQRGLGVELLQAQWVLSGYGLAFGGCLLLGGRLGDLYGRRRMLVAGLAVFGAAAAAAGFAPSLEALVAARVLQGLG